MRYLPIHLNLRDTPCLVVGAGVVATGKVDLLLRAGAQVHVVAPAIGSGISALCTNSQVTLIERPFELCDLDGPRLVIAATADKLLNQRVVTEAGKRGLLANAVTDAEAGQFIMPAIIDRDPMLLSVSTGGTSPALARFIRSRLEILLPNTFGHLAALAGEFRERVKNAIKRPAARRAFWDSLLEGPVAEMVHTGQLNTARQAINTALDEATKPRGDDDVRRGLSLGEVYLVGAGPGDPDLLSLRAMRLIQQADVVLYDRLVSPAVLDLVRRDAERIYAGKRRDEHTLAQESINQCLVRLAKEGKKVLRLKGGDPFVFGRGGEEIVTLAEEKIPFQVVPGITAALGCAAYAGIPLTHRDYAHTCIFATGHLKDDTVDLNWTALAHPRQTVVFYMGLTSLPIICAELIHHGLPSSTPSALIQQGTTPTQRVLTGTLSTIHELGCDMQLPTLFIVGEVVKLHEQMTWFHPQRASVNTG